MKRRKFLTSLGAAVALMATDPMFGGTAWGMDGGIDDRRPPMVILRVTGGRLPPDVVDRIEDFMKESRTGPWHKFIEDVDSKVEGSIIFKEAGSYAVQGRAAWQTAYGVDLKAWPERPIGGLVDEDGWRVIINAGPLPVTFTTTEPD